MTRTALHADRLTIGYRPPRRPPIAVASDLALTLTRGEFVCLLGVNGAGKTTLMRTLAGMQAPLAGSVVIDGMDVRRLSAKARAQRLSIVLTDRPDVGLLNGYALVALGRHPFTDWAGRLSTEDSAIVREAIRAVGADDCADRPVMQLSDGQRQKLMIARALAQTAHSSGVMLLDEPTAYLDLPRRAEIMQLLRTLAHTTDCAILASTHDLDLALRLADRLWLLADGVLYSGTPEDLVISGVFEKAFASAGATFDSMSGTFRVSAGERGLILVHGDSMTATWTRRALVRIGYSAAAASLNGTPPVASIAIDEGEVPRWRLTRAGVSSGHDSIASLIAALA